MKTRKDRRHSGREVTKLAHPEVLPLEETVYDEWNNYRDGNRNHKDFKKIKVIGKGCLCSACVKRRKYVINKKLKKREKIRKIKKVKA